MTSQGPHPPLAECVWSVAKLPTSPTISTYHSACIRFAADDSKVRTKLSKTQRVHALSLHGENLTPKFGGRHPRSFQKRCPFYSWGGAAAPSLPFARRSRVALPSAADCTASTSIGCTASISIGGGVTLETSLSKALYPMCWVWTAAWKAFP